nr:PREDICTED: coilin [Lepisosteus oculatus]
MGYSTSLEAGELQAQEDLDKPTRRRRRKKSEASELQAQEDLDKRRRKKKKKEKKGRQPSAEPAPGPVPQESGAAAASGERKGGVRPGPPTSSDSSSDEEPRSSSASAKTSSAAQQGDRAQSGPSSSVPGGRAAAGRRPSDSPGSTGPGPERGSPERAGEAPVPRARAESSSSDSSSGDEPLIRHPGLRGGDADRAPRGVAGAARGLGRGPAPGAGGVRGRGDGRFPWRGLGPRGGRGRARAGPRNHVYYNYNGGEQQHDGDALTNSSVVLQNPAADAPKRDYSLLPLLAAPPAVGQLIAFKLLELTENYSPEVSDYKEGRIVGFDQSTRQLELELLSSAPAAPAEPGKFDLVYHTPDGAEIVEYAVSRGSKLTERWDSLLEPRLIVDGAEGGLAGAAD